MCRIFGLIASDSRWNGIGAARAATEALRHRGPDDSGLVAFVPPGLLPGDGEEHADRANVRIEFRPSSGPRTAFLGHRRLSVIDRRAAGRQPMRQPDSGACITYNGEIYNYRELRAELAASGTRFSTATDTEVVLEAFRTWGPRSVETLRDMLAFGIWDPERAELFLARDRLGKKPLFFHQADGCFAFASELKAFLALPGWRSDINPASTHDYLTFGYVPGEQTIFRDVWKVPAGSYLVWKDGEVRAEKYWNVQSGFRAPAARESEDAVCDEVRALLAESVKLRLVGDVPLGAFLSGGLDSSAVVGLMSRQLGAPVKTFSIGFRESSFDELEHARVVARHFETDHREFIVEAQAAEVLPDLAWWMDEPFADASMLPTFLLAWLAREHVTTVLTGDGGDESFAGYDSYRAERRLVAYQRMPGGLRRMFESLLANRREGRSRTALVRRAKRFVEKRRLPFERREWRMIFSDEAKRGTYRPEFAVAIGARDSLDRRAAAFHEWDDLDPVTQLQLWDLSMYLPDDLMVKTDRATMTHGLESRCPLPDHVLVERCARIPSARKRKGGATKHILKRAVADLVPPAVIARAKQGFGFPVSRWFRSDLRDLAHDVLLSPECLDRGYFRAEAPVAMLGAHESGRADHGHKIWSLVTLELWHRQFANGAGRPSAASSSTAARP